MCCGCTEKTARRPFGKVTVKRVSLITGIFIFSCMSTAAAVFVKFKTNKQKTQHK
jgi:hypothetical protein